MTGQRLMMWVMGLILTTVGITLVFQQWDAVVVVFKALIGPLTAVAGLVLLFAASLNR